MPPSEEKFDLGKTIGSIETNLSNIKYTVEKVNAKVDTLNDKLIHLNNTAVKQDECKDGCGKVERKVDSVRTDIAAIHQDLSKKQTRRSVPTIHPVSAMHSLPDDTSRYRLNELSRSSEVQEEEKRSIRQNLFQRLKDNAIAITTVVGLVTMISVGFLKLARFVVRVEDVLKENQVLTEKQTKNLKAEIKRIDDKPRVVYVPVYPDAGSRPTKRARRTKARSPVRAPAAKAPGARP